MTLSELICINSDTGYITMRPDIKGVSKTSKLYSFLQTVAIAKDASKDMKKEMLKNLALATAGKIAADIEDLDGLEEVASESEFSFIYQDMVETEQGRQMATFRRVQLIKDICEAYKKEGIVFTVSKNSAQLTIIPFNSERKRIAVGDCTRIALNVANALDNNGISKYSLPKPLVAGDFKLSDLYNALSGYGIQTDKEGSLISKTTFDCWYSFINSEPAGELITGMDGESRLNCNWGWRNPIANVVADPAKYAKVREVMLKNLAGGDEKLLRWLLGWVGYRIKNGSDPKKCRTSVLLQGPQGCFKSEFANMISVAAGGDFCMNGKSDDSFSIREMFKFFIILDESLAHNADQYDWFKKITGMYSKEFTIKGQKSIFGDLCMSCLFLTNNIGKGMYLGEKGENERRLVVLQCQRGWDNYSDLPEEVRVDMSDSKKALPIIKAFQDECLSLADCDIRVDTFYQQFPHLVELKNTLNDMTSSSTTKILDNVFDQIADLEDAGFNPDSDEIVVGRGSGARNVRAEQLLKGLSIITKDGKKYLVGTKQKFANFVTNCKVNEAVTQKTVFDLLKKGERVVVFKDKFYTEDGSHMRKVVLVSLDSGDCPLNPEPMSPQSKDSGACPALVEYGLAPHVPSIPSMFSNPYKEEVLHALEPRGQGYEPPEASPEPPPKPKPLPLSMDTIDDYINFMCMENTIISKEAPND